MRRMKILFIALGCALISMSLIVCAAVALENNADSGINIISVDAGELLEPIYGELDPTMMVVADGANDFALRMGAALSEEVGNDNFLCSPYSVWLPLAALLNATDDRSRTDFLSALSISGISDSEINNAASRMLYDLTKQRDKKYFEEYNGEYHNPLRIANAIFVGKNVTIKKDFAQVFMDYYRGCIFNVDFTSGDAVAAINKWAMENTEGLITDIVRDIDPNTVAAIANAIYFSDRWQWEFNPEQTTEDIFYSPNGDTTAHYMLREGDSQTYYEDDKVQAMPILFQSGGGMYFILPKDGDAQGLLSTITSEYLDDIRRDSIYATGRLLLPRFTIESDVMELRDTLTKLGVTLFDSKAAPLTGGLLEETIPLWLSSALHKAVIEVDEKGVTAAAVTEMFVCGSMMPEPTEPFEMKCDKPFLFILYGSTYDGGNQILFIGVVNQP